MSLAAVQERVRELILENSWFGDLPVVLEARGNLEAEIEQSLNALGLSLVVATPGSSVVDDRKPVPYLRVEIVVGVAALPLVNQTGKTAAEAVDRLIPLLHGERVAGQEGPAQIRFVGHEAEDLPDLDAYRVRFQTHLLYQ